MKLLKITFLPVLFFPALTFGQETILALSFMPQNTWMFNSRDMHQGWDHHQNLPTFGKAVNFEIGYNFSPPVGLHSGVIYSQQGQTSTAQDETGTTVTTRRDLTYIKVPLMLHFSTDPGPVMVFMGFGPSVGVLTDATMTYTPAPERQETVEAQQLYKQVDVMVCWRLGVDIGLGNKVALVLQHIGDRSLGDMENKNLLVNGQRFYNSDRSATKNLTLGFGAGLKFVIGGARKYYCGPGH